MLVKSRTLFINLIAYNPFSPALFGFLPVLLRSCSLLLDFLSFLSVSPIVF